ncbi:mitochondrial 37S ribosomal protein rsm10 [Quaeritorhiza haematococci]|nr:mitochondrial 37S ribosomal protein rsm10 [Quaeritorhiza haematococci]
MGGQQQQQIERHISTAIYGQTRTNISKVDESLEIPAIPEPPRPHNILVGKLELRGYMPDHLDFVAYFARYSAHQLGISCDPPIHLPDDLERWNVIKGPFIHAKTKEVFERQTHRRLLQVFDADPKVVSQWVSYVNRKLPAGVEMHVDQYVWENAEIGKKVATEIEAKEAKKVVRREPTFDELVKRKADEFVKRVMAGAAKKSGNKRR